MTLKSSWLCLPGLVLLAVGCSSRGTITGTVTYKGTPIPQGTVLFWPTGGGPSVSAAINDGKYTAEKVPTGPAKVGVISLVAPSGQEGAMAKAMYGGKGGPPPDAKIPEEARKLFSGGDGGTSKKGLQIPDKYGNPDESGLTYTVTGGSQTKDFNLD